MRLLQGTRALSDDAVVEVEDGKAKIPCCVDVHLSKDDAKPDVCTLAKTMQNQTFGPASHVVGVVELRYISKDDCS